MINFRKASKQDCKIYFDWANDEVVREQSFNSNVIAFETHNTWFNTIICNPKALLLVFENENKKPIGQVRFQNEENNITVVGVSVDASERGKGFASIILNEATNYFLNENKSQILYAYIKVENTLSIRSFEKAGFLFKENTLYNKIPSILYTKIINK